MIRILFVLLALFAVNTVARAQTETPVPARFGVGVSLTGGGAFGTGLLGAGLPGDLGAALRLELPNLIARGVGAQLEVGTDGVSALAQWRADLSADFNLTLAAGFGLSGYTDPGLTGRFGAEYRFGAFAVALEYGLTSTFGVATPATRSRFALSVLWFLG
jgi:hypothetical protein